MRETAESLSFLAPLPLVYRYLSRTSHSLLSRVRPLSRVGRAGRPIRARRRAKLGTLRFLARRHGVRVVELLLERVGRLTVDGPHREVAAAGGRSPALEILWNGGE